MATDTTRPKPQRRPRAWLAQAPPAVIVVACTIGILVLMALAFWAGRSTAPGTVTLVPAAPAGLAPTAAATGATGTAGQVTAAPGATGVNVPGRIEVPPSRDAAGLRWFDAHGPASSANAGTGAGSQQASGQQGVPGIWQRTSTDQAWQWTPLTASAVTDRTYSGAGTPPAPDWPADPTQTQVHRVVRPDGTLQGYWVWNAGNFAGTPGQSLRWSPGWEWTPQDQPLLLTPSS
jgi:hypothetical protein